MFEGRKYWTERREAAIWILSKVVVKRGMVVTGLVDNGKREEINAEKRYDTYLLSELAALGIYKKETLYEAAYLLNSREHLVIFQDQRNIYNSQIEATKAGELAYKEEDYEEEIKNNRNDRIFRKSRWQLPAIAIFISLFALAVSIFKKSNTIIQLIPSKHLKDLTTKENSNGNSLRQLPKDNELTKKNVYPKSSVLKNDTPLPAPPTNK